jgi:tagatose-6-phosphate ketose/aldose isomerase
MPRADELAKEAAAFDYGRIIYLGSGGLKGLAREGAIKSLELTDGKINAGFDSPMGFRHGPKAAVKNNALTVHFISPLPFTGRYDIDFLKELIREKKGNRIAAVVSGAVSMPGGADYGLSYASVPEDEGFKIITAYINGLVFLQLLSMEKSVARGVPTDSPSAGGEINRVVKGVTIYDLD